ncbi:T7SS effector LXG polymorphic toxin [Carnobacterium divergens]|uniref:T7SS effector LXG polymorphic toxin n=1 Tax=Carnobacterium divergens TaxID=2748 RepID=UPI0039AF90E0
MGIKMFAGEVTTQTSSIKSYCTNIMNGMTKIQTVLSKIILEPSLQGNTYDSAKNYFKTAYLPATRGFILVCETAIRANEKLITDYKSNVDVNDLQEDILVSQMSRLDSMSTALNSIAIPKVFTQNVIDNLQEAKGKTAKKLTQLREFNHKSASIFEELEQQLQNLERGVALIAEGKAWNGTTGTFSTAGLNMDWAQNIEKNWEERDKKNKKDKKLKMLNQLKNKNIQYTNDKKGKHWRINGEPVTDLEMIAFLNKNSDKLESDGYSISELKITKDIVLFGPGGFTGATTSISGGGFALRNLADAGKTIIGAGWLLNQLNNLQVSKVQEEVTSNKGKTYDNTPSKNHKKVNEKDAEITGDPDSSVDIYNNNGDLVRRRWFDSDGRAIRDIDYTNHGHPKNHPEVPHEHNWTYDKGRPMRSK